MSGIRAIHVLRTPRGSAQVRLATFEILTMALSALEWRAHNGPITLVTDSKGRAWAEALGIASVWDAIDVRLDEMDDVPIDEAVFWAAGKLFALRAQEAPCVIIDLDFIVWQTLDFTPYGTGVAAIHSENIWDLIYPPPETLQLQTGYALPGGLDDTVRPLNGARVYHGDTGFLHRYAQAAIDFMLHADAHGDDLPYMVFAEQRLLAMLAEKEHRPIYEMMTLPELFGNQKCFTHLWGYKRELRSSEEASAAFCARLRRRIAHDFPDAPRILTTERR